MSHGLFIIIAGPSGSGKGAVIKQVLNKFPQIKLALSLTTRKPRPNEQDGDIYHYVSLAEFKKAIKNNELLEWAKIHNEHFSGTLKNSVINALAQNKVVLRELDMQGIQAVKKIFSKQEILTLFITLSSWRILKQRIIARAPITQKDLNNRYQSYKKETRNAQKLADYLIVNSQNKLPETVNQVCQIIKKELKKRKIAINHKI